MHETPNLAVKEALRTVAEATIKVGGFGVGCLGHVATDRAVGKGYGVGDVNFYGDFRRHGLGMGWGHLKLLQKKGRIIVM